ncbi:MAG: hypothetical protein HKP41_05060 [Desulfobacterales bacterium]|nr:hypothetical protein [Desulfobacterales bacterium]
MSSKSNASEKLSPITLNIYRILVLGGFTAFLCGALTIPFYYETQTLWYKVGIDNTLLRTAQLAGMLALALLFVQITLSVQSMFLKMLFGGARILRWHQRNGVLIAFLALSHVFLVLAPEGMANLPIGKKHWPEMVGALLFALVTLTVVGSYFRQKLNLNYKTWKAIHQPLGYLVIALVTVHVLYVSESFEQNVPKISLLIAFFGIVLQVVIVKLLVWRSKKRKT